jgi:5-methyltetrahydropteroyltriglutamate--homocysteine methyltransferase
MPRTTPPFRADHVGSLLRTAPLKVARETRERNALTAAELKSVEDAEIVKIIARQEEIGLQAITDGEFRRAYWHFDFLQNLNGCEGYWMEPDAAARPDPRTGFKGATLKPWMVRVISKVGFPPNHPFIDHFRFVLRKTRQTAKMTIPSPSMLNYRAGRKVISETAYPRLEDYYADLARAYADAVKAFYDAGCRYLQFDDVSLAYFCDPVQRQMLIDRGDDPDTLIRTYRDVINTALAAKPSDMVISAHLCRGNFRSTFVASGGYQPVADILFRELGFDAYFLEWDSERAGGLEPLRHLPRGHKIVVLGLVTTKTGVLESKDALKKRIAEAASFVPMEQLALSPQCGFASTEEGNMLSEEEQWAKLRLVVETAQEVWG